MIQLNPHHVWYLIAAAQWTVLLSLLAFAGGLLVGLPIALMRVSPSRTLRIAAGGYIQLIQGMLADSVTELFAARASLHDAARGVDEGRDPKVQHAQASMCKLYASEMAGRVADRAVQIFGGRGYMRENVAERFFRELRVERIWEGTSEVQRVIIAGQLAKRGVRALA